MKPDHQLSAKNHPLTDLFDKIYIINLVHRTDRRAEMVAELEKIGLSLDHPSVYLFPAVKPDEYDGWASQGTKGCFMSHLGVLQNAAQNGHKRILILEDDLNFIDNFVDIFTPVSNALDALPWDIFYGGYRLFDGDEERLTAMPSELLKNSGIDFCDELASIAHDIPTGTTHFIAFSSKTIAHLVTYLTEMAARPPGDIKGGPMHVDGAYTWFRAENSECLTLMATPQLGYQRNSATDIGSRKWFDKLPVISFITARLRKLRNSINNSKSRT